MNIYITENVDQSIDGFMMVPILYGKVNMCDVPNNSANKIVAADALDSIPHSLLLEFLSEVRRKMRIGSELVLGGRDLSLLAKDVMNSKIDSQAFNEIVFNKRGIYDVNDIVSKLNAYGLIINYVTMKGPNYEISAARSTATN